MDPKDEQVLKSSLLRDIFQTNFIHGHNTPEGLYHNFEIHDTCICQELMCQDKTLCSDSEKLVFLQKWDMALGGRMGISGFFIVRKRNVFKILLQA